MPTFLSGRRMASLPLWQQLTIGKFRSKEHTKMELAGIATIGPENTHEAKGSLRVVINTCVIPY